MPGQGTKTFDEVSKQIYRHLEERDWLDNTPRSLAASIVLEAAELLEHYQWQDKPVGTKDDLAEELADIFIYAFEFAQAYDIDIPKAIDKKLQKTAKKYPAEAFKDKTKAEREKNWLESKLKHQKEGL